MPCIAFSKTLTEEETEITTENKKGKKKKNWNLNSSMKLLY